VNEQDVWSALRDLLTYTSLGDNVYDYGKVPGQSGNPGELPTKFALLSVARRYVPPNRSGGTTVTGYRASVRFVGSSPVNARIIGGWVREAFESQPGRGKRITLAGVKSTVITHETTTEVEPDDGMYSGVTTYTLAL
jgi:hypothetical protein